MTTTGTEVLDHWIAGAPHRGTGTRTGPVYDPAKGEVARHVRFATPQDDNTAVGAAREAFAAWSQVSLAKRQQVMFAFRELLATRQDELAQIITAEHGKVLSDARGEIARGLEVVEFACGAAAHLKGEYSVNVSTGVDVYSVVQPLGVVRSVSPFNFPAMVPLWFFPLAVAAGNGVVLKPSEKDPSAASWLAALLHEAGLPDGGFNVVHGDREAVDALLTHPDVSAISFVGSTPIAKHVYETATAHGKRVQALGGAKNHMLVLPDADLDLVADAAVNAGYGSAGERCMAISVVLAVESIADELVAKIRERMAGLRIGDGRRGTDMGPLITGEHRDRVASYVDVAVADGAELVVDGRTIEPDGDPSGFWLGPTLLDRVPTSSRAYTDEIFGPVLSLVRVSGYEEGLEIVNANPYGNGAAIFTNDGGAVRRFQLEVTAGMVGVNVPIPVPVAYYSFGGWKASLFGDAKAYGRHGLTFFTREKAGTSRWLDPSHGGRDLGFPEHDATGTARRRPGGARGRRAAVPTGARGAYRCSGTDTPSTCSSARTCSTARPSLAALRAWTVGVCSNRAASRRSARAASSTGSAPSAGRRSISSATAASTRRRRATTAWSTARPARSAASRSTPRSTSSRARSTSAAVVGGTCSRTVARSTSRTPGSSPTAGSTSRLSARSTTTRSAPAGRASSAAVTVATSSTAGPVPRQVTTRSASATARTRSETSVAPCRSAKSAARPEADHTATSSTPRARRAASATRTTGTWTRC